MRKNIIPSLKSSVFKNRADASIAKHGYVLIPGLEKEKKTKFNFVHVPVA